MVGVCPVLDVEARFRIGSNWIYTHLLVSNVTVTGHESHINIEKILSFI